MEAWGQITLSGSHSNLRYLNNHCTATSSSNTLRYPPHAHDAAEIYQVIQQRSQRKSKGSKFWHLILTYCRTELSQVLIGDASWGPNASHMAVKVEVYWSNRFNMIGKNLYRCAISSWFVHSFMIRNILSRPLVISSTTPHATHHDHYHQVIIIIIIIKSS